MDNLFYTVKNHKDYPDDGNHQVVVWDSNIFMPFDLIKGLDHCPPDNKNYKRKYVKKHWWSCPRTKHDGWSIHDAAMFVDLPEPMEFTNLDKAVKYCMKWRKQWLKQQLSMKLIKEEEKQLENGEA